jgi:hypothetical protein
MTKPKYQTKFKTQIRKGSSFDIWNLANGVATPSAHHPHLDPLPSRERKFGSQIKKGGKH